jgi:hypothetical protein
LSPLPILLHMEHLREMQLLMLKLGSRIKTLIIFHHSCILVVQKMHLILVKLVIARMLGAPGIFISHSKGACFHQLLMIPNSTKFRSTLRRIIIWRWLDLFSGNRWYQLKKRYCQLIKVRRWKMKLRNYSRRVFKYNEFIEKFEYYSDLKIIIIILLTS